MASPPVRSSTLPTSLPSEVGRDDEQGENGSSPPQPGHMPSRWDGKGPLDSAVPEEMTGLHWENCCNYVDKYDEDICRVWKEEIDKLLIFAGLFSAAVTAFAVEAFQWLEDPSDANTALLAQLVALQLNGAPDPPTAPFRPGASAIRINIFWFTSLTLSLGSVLVGILCLQWLREYQRPVPTLSFKDRLIYRQNRYDGLIAWKVPEIVSTLPLLLQISVILFFAGVFDLLWERNQIVALVILVQFIIITLLLALSAIIPALQIARSWFSYNGATQKNWPIYKQCPYKSPQSWLACHFILYVLDVVWRCVDHSSEVSLWTQMRVNFSQTSWFAFDEFCFAFGNRQVTSSIGWMQKNCPRNSKITHQLYQCISDLGHGELPAIWETTQAFSPSEAWKSLMKDKDSEAYKTSTLSTPSYRELLSAFFLDTFHQSLPATVEHWIRAVNAEPLLLKKMPARRFLEELPEDKHATFLPQILLCIETFLQNRHYRDEITPGLIQSFLDILSRTSKRTSSPISHYLIQQNMVSIQQFIAGQGATHFHVLYLVEWLEMFGLYWLAATDIERTKLTILDLVYAAGKKARAIQPSAEIAEIFLQMPKLSNRWLPFFHFKSWEIAFIAPVSGLWWKDKLSGATKRDGDKRQTQLRSMSI